MLGRLKQGLKKLSPIDIDFDSVMGDLEEFKMLPTDVQDKLRRGFIERIRIMKEPPKEKPKPRKILPEPSEGTKRWFA